MLPLAGDERVICRLDTGAVDAEVKVVRASAGSVETGKVRVVTTAVLKNAFVVVLQLVRIDPDRHRQFGRS